MALFLRFRDIFMPPGSLLAEAGIKEGASILDYGCGPGSYSIKAAQLVGERGKVYALDIHPLALKKVEKAAKKKELSNIRTILSNCATGLESASMDVVLLYDLFHDLKGSEAVLEEIHRVLKPEGVLSFSDHHMKEEGIISKLTEKGLFEFSGKGRRTFTFHPLNK